jgi:hypothetical protein
MLPEAHGDRAQVPVIRPRSGRHGGCCGPPVMSLHDHAHGHADSSSFSHDQAAPVAKKVRTEALAPSPAAVVREAPVPILDNRYDCLAVQLEGAGVAGADPGAVHAIAAAGVSGAGQALPHAAAIQASFGDALDVSQVTAHVGGPAADAAQRIGATAYATGDHVALPANPDLHTTAHEVAHVAQQRQGVHLKGGVGAAGDSYERHADAVADRVVAGQLATDLLGHGAAGRRDGDTAVQRKTPAPDASAVGGDGSEAEALEDLTGAENVAGQFGHSQIISSQGGADKAAAKHIATYAGAHLVPIHPDFSVLQTQKTKRAEEGADIYSRRSAGYSDNVSHQRRLVQGRDWCEGKVAEWQQYETTAQQMFQEYNGWVPFANGAFTALARLEGMQELLGVSDPAKMVETLVAGLDDADQVASQLISVKGQNHANLPRSDSSVALAGSECVNAFKSMNTEYLEYQQNLLAWLSAKVDGEGDAARAKLAEIEQVKGFVRQVGGLVDTTMGHLKAAPGRISAATEGVAQAYAQVGASMNQRAALDGKPQTWNPTFVTTDEDGALVSRNMQTGMDSSMTPGADGKAVKTPSPAGDGVSLPMSVGDLAGAGVDLLFAGEVAALQRQLNIIATKVAAIDKSKQATEMKHKTDTFTRSVEVFGTAAFKMKKTIEQRRKDYVDFGMQLDEFANGDKKMKKEGLDPGKGKERYATVMMMASQIREVVSIGRDAKAALQYDGSAWTVFILQAEDSRAERPDVMTRSISDMEMPKSESDIMWQVPVAINGYQENMGMLAEVLGPVDARTQALMLKIGADQGNKKDPGGGPSNY